jgi:hypothetical protein
MFINKESYNLKKVVMTIASIITTLGIIIGAFIAVEDRYANKDDVVKVEKDVNDVVTKIRVDNLVDRMFELNLKKDKTEADKAILYRYRMELEYIYGKKQNR